MEFTSVVAIDRLHIRELNMVWPTWKRYRPEIMINPLLLIADHCILDDATLWRAINFIDHNNFDVISTRQLAHIDDQRQHMLSALVLLAPYYIQTKWYMKLDTDAVAMPCPLPLYQESWFRPDRDGREMCFIASPWGYTKPANAIGRLDDWGDNIDEMKDFKRLNIPYDVTSDRIRHQRITSWCFWGNRDWSIRMAATCQEQQRLPVASHDTFLWYCAERTGSPYRKVSMKKHGWRHVPGRQLASVTQQVLQG